MQVNVYEAKTGFSALLERVANGEPVVIARAGKPIARLVPIGDAGQHDNGVRFGGLTAKQLKLSPDFHAPMSDEDLIGA
jgi:prevent-host-death family protein